jgi:hypothetical protein
MQFTLKFNPENTGLKTLFREWQITTLRLLWEAPHTRFSTKEAWMHVRDNAENGVSRATVYHFLDNIADKGIIRFARAILYTTTPTRRVIEAGWHTGRWEWMVIGEFAKPSDSLGASMITAALGDWKNVQVWLSGLDFSSELGPSIPWTIREFNEPVDTAKDANYHDYPDDMRASFRDDWSTPDDWAGETINPYAVSSGNLVVVGGLIANLGAEYFNDFTDALIFTEYGDGFYALGCWARTVLDHYQGKTFVDGPDDELWYDSNNVDDDVGHAIISVYKDLNETTGLVVYGYTAEDTYYASYAFRGGLLAWLQEVQPGTTTILLEIDYSELHPVRFHVVESLGHSQSARVSVPTLRQVATIGH